MASTTDDEDDDDWARIRQRQREEEECVVSSCVQLMILALKNEEETANLPRPPKKRRNRRRAFNAHAAYDYLLRDHLGPNPLFGKEFKLFFRLSRARVEILLNDFGRYSERYPFYKSFRVDKVG